MKLDYSTNPPTAWQVEDGDWAPIDPRDVLQCSVCKKWYVNKSMFKNDGICSPGCRLRKTEAKL
jgi:hypothetical protein